MIVTLFRGLKASCKMLSVREFYSKFVLEQTNVFLNAIKTAGGNNTVIICDGKQVKQGFLKIFNKIKPQCTTDNLLFSLILLD